MISIFSLKGYVDERIVDILYGRGYKNLFEHQYRAVLKGLDDLNIIINVPTGGGKTLIAEILLVDWLLKNPGKKVVYVAPLRSLAREKMESLKKWYALGLKVGLVMGEYWISEGSLNNKDIIVTTYQKFISLVNHKSSFIRDVGFIVIDEFHIMSPEVEVISAMALKEKWKIVALSATIGNLDDVAAWLNAKIYRSSERPIKLRGGVLYNGRIIWVDGHEELIGNNWMEVVKSFVDDGLSVIVFVNSRKNAEKYARMIAGLFECNNNTEISQNTIKFQYLICRGVAFHHAGLKNKERNEIEDLYRMGKIRVLVATKTLAMGVNLPADVVILKDIIQFTRNKINLLDAMDVWQMLGRAGRSGKSQVGIGLIYTRKRKMVNKVIKMYFEGDIEKVASDLIKVVDSVIITYLAYYGKVRLYDIVDFVSLTFGGFMNDNLLLISSKVLDRLIVNGIVEKTDDGYYGLSKKGKLIAQLFISPETTKKMISFNAENELDILWFITGLKEFELPKVSKMDYDNVWFVADMFANDKQLLRNKVFLARAKSLSILLGWINGKELDELSNVFNIGFGDLRIMLETAEWLSFALYKIKTFFKEESEIYSDVVWMIKYGVRRELVPFVKIRGVGRKRALQLFENFKFKNEKEMRINRNVLTYWVGG